MVSSVQQQKGEGPCLQPLEDEEEEEDLDDTIPGTPPAKKVASFVSVFFKFVLHTHINQNGTSYLSFLWFFFKGSILCVCVSICVNVGMCVHVCGFFGGGERKKVTQLAHLAVDFQVLRFMLLEGGTMFSSVHHNNKCSLNKMLSFPVSFAVFWVIPKR